MSTLSSLISSKEKIIEQTDVNHIYVENIRKFFNLTTPMAKRLCDAAVKLGFFEKHYEYRCPIHGSVIASSEDYTDSNLILCQNCQLDENEKFQYNLDELVPHPYFKMKQR